MSIVGKCRIEWQHLGARLELAFLGEVFPVIGLGLPSASGSYGGNRDPLLLALVTLTLTAFCLRSFSIGLSFV